MFESSTHNERIKAIYGNYGFWAWFNYWYLETAEFVSMQLIDKGYYDYDYEEPKPKQVFRKERTEAEEKNIFARFGFGHISDSISKAEKIQQAAMNMNNNNKN